MPRACRSRWHCPTVGASSTTARSTRQPKRSRRRLLGADWVRETEWGVAGPRDARLLVALYAVLRLQCCALVIDGEWKADETARRLTAIGAKYVVSTVPTGDIDYPVPVVVVDVDRSRAPGGRPLDTASALHAPAYIAYTSGSTGEPKAVEVTHASLLHYGVAVADRLDYRFGGGRTFGHLTTLSADLGHTAWMLALVTGGRTHVFEDDVVRNPSLFWAQAAAGRFRV